MTALAAALALADTGIPVFPLNAEKRPMCPNGFHGASLDPAVIRDLFSNGAPLIGVPTGAASGLTVVDVDPDKGGAAWFEAATLPTTRTHRTRRGGWHLLFAYEPGTGCSQSKLAPGIDVRSEGGYIVWWPAAGCDVLNADVRAPMPVELVAAAKRRPDPTPEMATIIRAARNPSTVAALEALVDGVRLIRSAAEGTRHETVNAIQWRLAALVKSGHLDETTTADAVREAAIDAGGEDMRLVDQSWRGALGQVEPATVPGSEFQAIEPAAVAPVRPTMRQRFMHPAECAVAPKRGYIVKHLLAPGDVAAIIGPPGCGKSMLAPYLAYAVAQGRSVFGLRTRAAKTVYVAAEDMSGMRQRIHALRLKHGDAPDFAVVDCGNLRDPSVCAELRAAVVDYQPGLAIIDTVGAAFAGMDENSAEGMGQVVALARDLASIGCAVVLIHHTSKHGGDGTPRGHSVLNGTLDMSLLLAPKDDHGIIRGSLQKNRNGSTDIGIAFRFEAVELGDDDDGDAITAPRAVEVDRPRDVGPALAPRESRGVEILRSLPGSSVDEATWRAACEDQRLSTSDDPKNRAKVISAVLRSLIEKGVVHASRGKLALVCPGSEFQALE